MTSPCHKGERRTSSEDALLDAARAAILAVGWARTTLTDVAKRGGVSRMTIYRTWPDMRTLLADLMTREWSDVVGSIAHPADEGIAPRERIVLGVVSAVAALRENALYRRIVDVDPELLLPYLLDRRGRSQDAILELLAAVVGEGQATGSIRAGDPVLIARSVLLTAHGFVLSAHTMSDGDHELADYDTELGTIVDRYLAP